MYVEIYDVLLLLAPIHNKNDVNIEQSTPETRDINRQTNRRELRLIISRLQKTDENFFSKQLYNCLIRICPLFKQRPD